MNHKESYVLFGHLNGVRPHHPLGRKKARKFRGLDFRGVLLQGQPQDHPVMSPGKLSNHEDSWDPPRSPDLNQILWDGDPEIWIAY